MDNTNWISNLDQMPPPNQELKKYSDALELSTDIIVNISTDNTEKQRTINMLKAK